jgi:hypothetical protein
MAARLVFPARQLGGKSANFAQFAALLFKVSLNGVPFRHSAIIWIAVVSYTLPDAVYTFACT